MRRLRLAAIALGGVVFVGLVAALASGSDGRAPRADGGERDEERAVAARRAGRTAGREFDSAVRTDDEVNDPAATKRELARLRERYTGSNGPRLGDRLGPAEAELDEPGDGSVRQPTIIVPTTGEGAEVDDWDHLTPQARIDRARREVESALARAGAAATDEERDQWRAQASQALGAVRADFYGAGDEAGYAELEARIGG